MRILNALILSTALVLPFGGAVLAQEVPRITVTGEGTVEATPDIATVTLGVTTEGQTAAEAMAANATALTAVLDRLAAAGIEPRDIQTSNLSLNPNWTGYDSGTPKISGYVASNLVTVRVRRIDTLGTVLDAAIADGANTLNGIAFGVAEPRPLLDEARKRAVADAAERAALLAEAAGVTLGPILSIAESGGMAGPMPMFRADAAAEAPVPVAEGEIGLSANVTVVYEIQR